MIGRNQIINCLRDFCIGKEYVNAMWLEGADGVNKVDEYSDIDFWFDVKKDFQESFLYECIEKLQELGTLDSRVYEIRSDIAQCNVHLADTSEYLTLDLCVQSHEIRGKDVTCYVKNDIAELPLVIFDKSGIITYTDYTPNIEEIESVFQNNKSRMLQMSRVMKYINRKQYLEAYMKYIENIADSLVKIARLIYTPRHYEYVLCHISDHLPKETVNELSQFYQVTDFHDISNNLQKAKLLLNQYEIILQQKYGIKTDINVNCKNI